MCNEDIHLDMIRKCLFLVCQCFRQTWKKSAIMSTGNNRDFGGFNAYNVLTKQTTGFQIGIALKFH